MPGPLLRRLPAFAVLIPLLAILFLADRPRERRELPFGESDGPGGPAAPSDWFHAQRAFPGVDIDPVKLARARAQARVLREEAAGLAAAGEMALWQSVGPTNIGGRVADLAIHPTDPLTVYVGAAEGGVFKTTNGGNTWTPIFDDQESLSIGDITIHPFDPNTLYVGTGEPNSGGGSVTYGGVGVFKTTDGGGTWTHLGLENTRYIGRVAIDPANPERVFVAAMGALFSTNPERGVYRSTDGGASWAHVLAISDSTGAIDLAIDRQNPNRVFAATWERIRHPHTRRYGGMTSGIYRSTDGGDTWSLLGGGLPAPSINVGRIGITISLSNPLILYAIYADAIGNFAGVYKTTNGGDTWVRTNDAALAGMYSSYGWWFGNIRVSPTLPNRVFVLGLDAYRSNDGGASWQFISSSMHVDHHALEFAPTDTEQLLYEGNDGGLYRSSDAGTSWGEIFGLPITQFYTVEVDNQLPLRRYGGTQDNGTNRTLTGSPADWVQILGGDGFHVNVDPLNNSFVYAEYQYGSLFRSTDGGSSFTSGTSGIPGGDRKNWSTPVILDPSNPATVYYGSQRVWRSTNRAVSWAAISPDLTDGAGGSGGIVFGTLTTLAVAPTDPHVIYAGTDDANVWVTQNGGGAWTRIDAALPERWVTRLAVDPTAAAIAYVTLSGFRDDEPLPHVFRTTDFGGTWTPVSGNLPEAPVNDIVIDDDNPATWYVATDVGVYLATDGGAIWSALGAALPNGVVTDIELHNPTRTLIAGTYGRSLFTYDLGATTGIESAQAPPSVAPLLVSAAPNPMAAETRLRYELPRTAHVRLSIVDASGRVVRMLIDGQEPAGVRFAAWDGRNSAGRRVSQGVYFARLEAENRPSVRKIIVSR